MINNRHPTPFIFLHAGAARRTKPARFDLVSSHWTHCPLSHSSNRVSVSSMSLRCLHSFLARDFSFHHRPTPADNTMERAPKRPDTRDMHSYSHSVHITYDREAKIFHRAPETPLGIYCVFIYLRNVWWAIHYTDTTHPYPPKHPPLAFPVISL